MSPEHSQEIADCVGPQKAPASEARLIAQWKARQQEVSEADREAQRRSFAYGNLALDQPDTTREDIDKAADDLYDENAIHRVIRQSNS